MGFPRIVVEDATGELLQTQGEVTFGTRTGCEIVVDDPIAAARHCQFGHDGVFVVRDLGSVTGTWLDGLRVAGWTAVRDGSQIVFGSSRLLARIEDRDGVPALLLQLQRNAFWWRKPGKKVFDNDPDALVRAEVGFGRFPALRAANRGALALGAAVLLGAVAFASVMEPLADAGPLLPAHALVAGDAPVAAAGEAFARCRVLADEQGCDVCHETGAGTPPRKCEQCHGDLVAEASRRHPYHGDGVLGPLPAIAVDDTFCVVCHRDHAGAEWLKPAAAELAGACERCHGEAQSREALVARAPLRLPPPREQAIPAVHFPHEPHVAKGIDCAVCHRPDDDVLARRAAGVPDDALRQDFVEVPYETCASCHVAGAPLAGITAAQQQQWRAETPWEVRWHGTDDGGTHCAACHAATPREGGPVFGPAMRAVPRPLATASEFAAERARYAAPPRRHEPEFERHSDGQACTSCHVGGATVPAADAGIEPRVFWHGLHVADKALTPAAGNGAAVSSNPTDGCVSCHQDVRTAASLRDATTTSYHWPATAAEQAACTGCHRERDGEALALRALATTIAPERRTPPGEAAPDFPHDVHVGSAAFGAPGTLAEGCFACHTFEVPEGAPDWQAVPRTPDASVRDCSKCHGGHANVGGGACQQCHPATPGGFNSFLAAAAVAPGTPLRGGRTAPAAPTRSWPGATSFSHFSRGHVGDGITCATCHDAEGTGAATDVATVPVPDDASPSCRECHLKRQFHWR